MKMRKKRKLLIAATIFLIIICVAPAEGDTLKKASFIPQWVPQAQFAGYYIGLEKGIYKKHGIDLTIITGGPDYSPSELLTDGRADLPRSGCPREFRSGRKERRSSTLPR